MNFQLFIFFIYFIFDEIVARYQMMDSQSYSVSQFYGYRPWPDGKIPYLITGQFSQSAHDMIMRTMEEFHQNTCVRFVPYSGERIYIRIVSENSMCQSFVGYIDYSYNVNLGPAYCTSTKGRVAHEFMHMLGFSHEHNRPDRDDYIFILYSNILPGYNSSFIKEKNGYGNNIAGLPYDYRSIMHYEKDAFSANGKPTIVAKNMNQNIQLGQYDGLSQGDIDKINIKYSCPQLYTSWKYSLNTGSSYEQIVPEVQNIVPTAQQFTYQKQDANYRSYSQMDLASTGYSYNLPHSQGKTYWPRPPLSSPYVSYQYKLDVASNPSTIKSEEIK